MSDTHGVNGEGWYGFDPDGTLAIYDKRKGDTMTCKFMRLHPALGLRCNCCDRVCRVAPAMADAPCVILNGLEPGQAPDYELAKNCEYYKETGNFCGTVRIDDAPGMSVGKTESLEQNVNHPSRYTRGNVECIDALESAVVGKSPDEAICVANVIKYLWRYEEKDPLRSLMSAEWYLKRLIEKVKARQAKAEECR